MRETLTAIEAEAARAQMKYGDPTSTHESLGVLLEEFAELQEAIHRNAKWDIKDEAIQIAAVALRLAEACIHGDHYFSHRSGFK